MRPKLSSMPLMRTVIHRILSVSYQSTHTTRLTQVINHYSTDARNTRLFSIFVVVVDRRVRVGVDDDAAAAVEVGVADLVISTISTSSSISVS